MRGGCPRGADEYPSFVIQVVNAKVLYANFVYNPPTLQSGCQRESVVREFRVQNMRRGAGRITGDSKAQSDKSGGGGMGHRIFFLCPLTDIFKTTKTNFAMKVYP